MSIKNEHLNQFKKGESGNPNGRPRKYVSLLKEHGYKLSEINDTIQSMMAMDMDEVKTVYENPNATILERTIANAMKRSLDKGSLYSLETLLTRVYGNPNYKIDIKETKQIQIANIIILPPDGSKTNDSGTISIGEGEQDMPPPNKG